MLWTRFKLSIYQKKMLIALGRNNMKFKAEFDTFSNFLVLTAQRVVLNLAGLKCIFLPSLHNEGFIAFLF